jgi:ATP-dependent DNA helicase RecG
MKKELEIKAIELLEASLKPLPNEKNELDWKEDLSDKSDKTAQHISAFANYLGGGFLVFGVNDDGFPVGVRNRNYSEIVKRLGNIARDGVVPAIAIDHSILNYQNIELLFVHIPESPNKPVYLRSGNVYDSYTRSAGQTRKVTRQELERLIATSRGESFETESAFQSYSIDEAIKYLDIQSFFDLLRRPFPQDTSAIISALESEQIVKLSGSEIEITNLGALLFAKDLNQFSLLRRKLVRVIVYEKTDRLGAIKEQEFTKGYASSFQSLLQYINDQLPRNEIIETALRKDVKMYPELAIRELIANAIIHQDFSKTGTGSMIEIFADRLEITNPGKPLINTNRFIDLPPQSRNEILASFMRRINICEERGSGVDKVISEVEFFQLPAPEFVSSEDHTKVILYSYRSLNKMEREDKIRACYQHCCLKYVSNSRMSNQTLRERFKIEEKNYATASRIIADTIDANLIKPADAQSKSKKFATYIPFWA